MQVLKSSVDVRAEQFKLNASALNAQIEALREVSRHAIAGGGEKYMQRHISRGKLPPRERIDKLLDPASPFLEIGQIAANGMANFFFRRRWIAFQ